MRELPFVVRMADDYRISNIPKSYHEITLNDIVANPPLGLEFVVSPGRDIFTPAVLPMARLQPLHNELTKYLMQQGPAPDNWMLFCAAINDQGISLIFANTDTNERYELRLNTKNRRKTDLRIVFHAYDHQGERQIYRYRECYVNGKHQIALEEPWINGVKQRLSFMPSQDGCGVDVLIINLAG